MTTTQQSECSWQLWNMLMLVMNGLMINQTETGGVTGDHAYAVPIRTIANIPTKFFSVGLMQSCAVTHRQFHTLITRTPVGTFFVVIVLTAGSFAHL